MLHKKSRKELVYSKRLNFLFQQKSYLTYILVLYSLIYYTYTHNLDKLIIQSHKILNNVNNNIHLNLNQLYIIECCKLIYDFHINTLPPKINSLFETPNQVHNHQTRQAHRGMYVPHQINRSFPLPNLSCTFWNDHCAQLFTPQTSKNSIVKNLKSILLAN